MSLYPGRQVYEARERQVEEELTISMIVCESRLGGGPHDTGRQLGARPDQEPAAPHSLQTGQTFHFKKR